MISPVPALLALATLLLWIIPILNGFPAPIYYADKETPFRNYGPLAKKPKLFHYGMVKGHIFTSRTSREERANIYISHSLGCKIRDSNNQLFLNFDSKSTEIIKECNVESQCGRRSMLRSVLYGTGFTFLPIIISATVAAAKAEGLDSNEPTQQLQRPFRSGGFGKEEYTNSFVASRDTNISPKEAYDTIMNAGSSVANSNIRDGSTISTSSSPSSRPSSFFGKESLVAAIRDGRTPRALDMGCGAGVSTQFLWQQGFHEIDAVDWSSDAWDRFVIEDPSGYCPPTVKFYEMDDERYRRVWRHSKANDLDAEKSTARLFDVIVYNFAINESKAKSIAQELLVSSSGRLLAPVNVQTDYWLKQEYRLYDNAGNVLWKAAEIGAWSVQFQPDVTQDSCQGIWCAPFNGFQKVKE